MAQGICFTEPIEDSNRLEMDTIHIQSIDMHVPYCPSVRKAPSLLVYRKKPRIDSLTISDNRPSLNPSPPKLTS